MKGFVRLEKKYGIRVCDDSYYSPRTGRFVTRYRMYAADGCSWENGLTREGVKAECERWSKELLAIKAVHDRRMGK